MIYQCDINEISLYIYTTLHIQQRSNHEQYSIFSYVFYAIIIKIIYRINLNKIRSQTYYAQAELVCFMKAYIILSSSLHHFLNLCLDILDISEREIIFVIIRLTRSNTITK